jgi:hypothetical protein
MQFTITGIPCLIKPFPIRAGSLPFFDSGQTLGEKIVIRHELNHSFQTYCDRLHRNNR